LKSVPRESKQSRRRTGRIFSRKDIVFRCFDQQRQSSYPNQLVFLPYRICLSALRPVGYHHMRPKQHIAPLFTAPTRLQFRHSLSPLPTSPTLRLLTRYTRSFLTQGHPTPFKGGTRSLAAQPSIACFRCSSLPHKTRHHPFVFHTRFTYICNHPSSLANHLPGASPSAIRAHDSNFHAHTKLQPF